MAIIELFSKRQKKLRGEVPDVYQYKDIPQALRVQIVHIIRDTFGKDMYGSNAASGAFASLHHALSKEYGVFRLTDGDQSDFKAVYDYFLKCNDYERVLDVIELSFRLIDTVVRGYKYRDNTCDRICDPDEAIHELNARFKEHGAGYQFESGKIIRVDSQLLHSETVKPVLQLLRKETRYEGANEEFLKAHEHYRNGRYKECLVDALKSFESVMKAICNKQGWPYNQDDSAKKLINICLEKGLIPSYMQTQFSSLRALLESGIPTVRNKLGGHGRGTANITVTEPVASYALYLTATNILFLTKLEEENFG